MKPYIEFGIMAFASYFTLMNPIGVMPVFITMTAGLEQKNKTKIAFKAVFAAFITVLLFMFSGSLLFDFFGISVNSLRVVGGVIFFLMGMDMLHARLAKTKIKNSEIKQYVNDISITPLAIPMICGPGAITNSIVLMEDAPDVQSKIILVFAALSVLIITFFVLYSASRLSKVLGETGLNVLTRLMGMIVMVIAVEFFFSGIKPLIQDIIQIP